LGSKNKLKRFKENLNFTNLFQPTRDDLIEKNFELRGKWNSFFKNDNPIALELGCGKGEYTTELAKLNPNKNYIGIDIKGARIWKGAKESIQNNLNNVCFIRTQIELIDKIFCNQEISEIWITFPDPQQKIQRKKHRLTNVVFMSMYKKILKKGGEVNLKTDSEFLHGYTLGLIEGMGIDPIFSNHDIYSNNNAPKEVLEIKTFYEKKFIDSKKITFLKFKFD
jgi:tRNA (guanine-N7-)-methyltransferase